MHEDKAFAATPARLQRARREGDLPRARELASVAALLGAVGATFALQPILASACGEALRSAATGHIAYLAFAQITACALAPAAASAVFATLASVAGTGLRFAPPPLRFASLDPLAGLRRMASGQSALAAGRAVVAAVLTSAVASPVVSDAFSAAAEVQSPAALAALGWDGVRRALAIAVALGCGFAVTDTFLERARRNKRLRMSFDELKREHKQTEGDPHVRGRRRAAHRALVRGSIGRLNQAAFVVTNPQHVAIALEYRPPAVAVPRVLIRAIDDGAQFVRRRARALGIPVIEDPPLARSLLALCEVEDYIPRVCYEPVAQIVASLLHEAKRA